MDRVGDRLLKALAILLCMCSCGRQGKQDIPIAAPVAKEYYAASEQFRSRDDREQERSNIFMHSGDAPKKPAEASGQVVDRWGKPVSGVRIIVSKESEETILGEGMTDEQGRFQIALASKEYRGLTLEAQAEGHEKSGFTGIYGGIVDYPVRLSEEIDQAFLEKVCAEDDPKRRLRMLLEIVGDRQWHRVKLETVFPQLGALRRDLRAVIASGQFDEKDVGGKSPASRAWDLLKYWCDPEDVELAIEKGLLERERQLPQELAGLAGDTVEEILKAHASEVDTTKHPRPSSQKVHYSTDRTRAIVEVYVLYAHWGYSYHLVMAQDAKQWRVVGRFRAKHFSGMKRIP